jgi:hypothetical protein
VINSQDGATSTWIKATASASAGQCVEMRRRGGVVDVRDSKHPEGPALHLSTTEFAAWLEGAKQGKFDHLA